jgi:hypothetical protein
MERALAAPEAHQRRRLFGRRVPPQQRRLQAA